MSRFVDVPIRTVERQLNAVQRIGYLNELSKLVGTRRPIEAAEDHIKQQALINRGLWPKHGK